MTIQPAPVHRKTGPSNHHTLSTLRIPSAPLAGGAAVVLAGGAVCELEDAWVEVVDSEVVDSDAVLVTRLGSRLVVTVVMPVDGSCDPRVDRTDDRTESWEERETAMELGSPARPVEAVDCWDWMTDKGSEEIEAGPMMADD